MSTLSNSGMHTVSVDVPVVVGYKPIDTHANYDFIVPRSLIDSPFGGGLNSVLHI